LGIIGRYQARYFFTKCITQLYLNVFLPIYLLAQLMNNMCFFKLGQKIIIYTENVYKVFKFVKILIIRIFVIVFIGFSIGIYKKASLLTKKLFICYNAITKSATEDKS